MYTVISVIIIIALLLLYVLWKEIGGKSSLKPSGNVLLIIAHPDDECMFFSPSILALTRHSNGIYLLCLSEGNFYGKGSIRQAELNKSAEVLGINCDHITIINDRKLPDDPQVQWNMDTIEDYIIKAIRKHDTRMIITFDHGGVSGHPNHAAISRAVKRMYHSHNSAGGLHILLLETTNLLRKYTGVLDLPLTMFSSKHKHDMTMSKLFKFGQSLATNMLGMMSCYAVGSIQDYLKARKAMAAHQSQYVWFRRLYITFSRYMIINTFKELK